MAHASLQVCMDSSDWLQGTMSDEMSTGLDSSSSPSGECMLAAACSSRGGDPAAPLMERRLRPPHDQNLKCPRCDSTHTKFCYYNNYSLSQPRYFCKTCRRYWTKGGTLRNIPVGGGCRKNKKSSSKKSSSSSNDPQGTPQGSMVGIGSVLDANIPTDLHLSFPQVQFPSHHLANLIGAQMSLGGGGGGGGDYIESGSLIRPIDFMESKYEGLVGVGGTRGHDFLGSGSDQFGVLSGIGDHHAYNATPFGVSNNDIHEGNYSSGGIGFMDQRLLLPYDHHGNNHDEHNQNHHHHLLHHHHHPQSGLMDVKPNTKLLSLEWQDHHGCTSDAHVNGGTTLGAWSGMMSGFQPSTTNSLV